MLSTLRLMALGAVPLLLICSIGEPLTVPKAARIASASETAIADSLNHIYRGSHSGFVAPLRAVAMDSASFRELWTNAIRGVPGAPAMPRIDFGRNMVAIAAMGGEPSTGFAIAIDSVVLRGSSVEVHVLLGSSGNLCVQGQGFISPVDIVEVPKRIGVVVFRDRHLVHECKMP